MTDATEKHGERVRRAILAAGLKLWADDPAGVTAAGIGRAVEPPLTPAAVLYHFGTVAGLKDAIAEQAVTTGASRVIAQLIIARHPAVKDMTPDARAVHMGKAG